MAAMERRTFRVRLVPSYFQERDLSRLLHRILSFDGAIDQIRVFSLASSVESYERPPTKVATVGFPTTPLALVEDRKEWNFAREDTGLPNNIIIDVHFLGFTVLNEVFDGQHEIDCFAISGLASHPFGSWKARDTTSEFMWIRDRLPNIRYGMRCIIYGYDTHLVGSRSFQNIDDIAIALTAKLRSIGCTAPSARPLIFLAHSLGGVILKQALVQMARSNDRDVELLSKIRHIILFGVPNRGMHISHLAPMVKGQPNESLVQQLSTISACWKDLDEQFSGISFHRDMRLISVYETQQSQVPKETRPGSWDRSGLFEVLVDRASAIHAYSKSQDVYAVDKDHSNLVKFAEDEPNLNAILAFIKPASYASSTLNNNGPRGRGAVIDTGVVYERTCRHDTQQTRLELKQSLFVDVDLERYESVETPYENTFGWVFQPNSTGLLEWLEDESSLFWINGKPGSGKSTLMKHICMHNRQVNKDTSRRSIVAHFFFFHRGTLVQKSFEGLLRSVLHQILQQSDRLTDLLLRYTQFQTQSDYKWTTTRLEAALYHVLQQRQEIFDLVLYLDALDEFDGDPEMIASFLLTCMRKAQRSQTRLKICFASRPWNVFNDKFTNAPQFCVEDQTARDMQFYIMARLKNHRASSLMLDSTTQQIRNAIEDLQKQIFQRANGVFLWVRLVLDTLLKELAEGASLEELRKILETLPAGIEQLYIALINRIPTQYRREGYIMLEIVLRADKPLRLQELWDAEQCAFQGLDHVGHYKCALQGDLFVDAETKSRRIRSRCGGLIEILEPTGSNGRSGSSVVQLMHQTAEEFLLGSVARHNLTLPGDHVAEMNGHSFLTQYHLTILAQFTDPVVEGYSYPWLDNRSWLRHFERYISHAKRAEMSLGRSQIRLFQSVGDNRYADFAKAFDRSLRTPWPSLTNSALSFAVIADLRVYVRDAITKSSPSPAALGYLLHCVVERQSYLGNRGDPEVERVPSLVEMFRLLLDAGADTTFQVNEGTLFEAIFRRWWINDEIRRVHFSESAMIKLLLDSPGFAVDLNAGIVMPPIFHGGQSSSYSLFTPLHLAALSGTAPLVELLLRKGANVHALSMEGGTPLEELYGAKFVLNTPQRACARLLLDYGGKPPRLSRGFTPDDLGRFRRDFPDEAPYVRPAGFMSRLKRRLKIKGSVT